MKKVAVAVLTWALFVGVSHASDYQQTVNQWSSPKDVATWLKSEWRFDADTSREMFETMKRDGPQAVTTKSAADTFASPRGWCKDSANFARESLNHINPGLKAEYIFIKNGDGRAPNHWSTGFRRNGEIYVMDFGAGPHWDAIEGVHGPYSSLDEYEAFLKGLNIDNLKVQYVRWMPSNADATPDAAAERAKVILGNLDMDGDGGISKGEAPPPMRANFTRLDKNDDGKLDVVELRAIPPR